MTELPLIDSSLTSKSQQCQNQARRTKPGLNTNDASPVLYSPITQIPSVAASPRQKPSRGTLPASSTVYSTARRITSPVQSIIPNPSKTALPFTPNTSSAHSLSRTARVHLTDDPLDELLKSPHTTDCTNKYRRTPLPAPFHYSPPVASSPSAPPPIPPLSSYTTMSTKREEHRERHNQNEKPYMEKLSCWFAPYRPCYDICGTKTEPDSINDPTLQSITVLVWQKLQRG